MFANLKKPQKIIIGQLKNKNNTKKLKIDKSIFNKNEFKSEIE